MLQATTKLFWDHSLTRQGSADIVTADGTIVAKAVDRLEARQLIAVWKHAQKMGTLTRLLEQAHVDEINFGG